MTSTKRKRFILLFIALILCPSGLGQNATLNSTLLELSALEARISTAWRNGDHKSLETNSREALMKLIPKALDGATNISEIVGYVTRSVPFLQVLSPIFSILSVVVDVINLTVFGSNSEFADLYNYLQDQFAVVNDRIKALNHAIQDVLSFLKCSEAYKEVKSRQIQIDASYDRYLEMTQRGRSDSKAAQELFDSQQRQFPSNQILREMRSLLLKKSLYVELIDHCAEGNITQYSKMMTELGETFMKAIFLDTAATTRLYTLSKSELDASRTKWKGHFDEATSLMIDAGNNLITVGWHSHYMNDVDKLMSSGSVNSISDLRSGDTIYSFLRKKYPYVTSVILVVKNSDTSISVVDDFGAEVKTASREKFLCYRGNRANGDSVIAICNNRIANSTENFKTVLTIKVQQKLKVQRSSFLDFLKTGKIDYTVSDGMPSVHLTGQFDEFSDLVVIQRNCSGSVDLGEDRMMRRFRFLVIAKRFNWPAWGLQWLYMYAEPLSCRAAALNPGGIAMTTIAASWLVVQRVFF